MSSFTDPYEDTLRSMRTGNVSSGIFTSTSKAQKISPTNKTNNDSYSQFFTWGNSQKDNESSSFISWPSWSQSAPSQPPSFFETFGLSMMQRYAAFGLCILGAALLFLLALVHLPMVVLSPSRFVVPFCLCNVLIFVSFGFIHGFVSYARHLFSAGRWPYSSALFISTGCTLYSAMGLKSYILTVATAIIQLISMATYFISYLPGGSSGIRMFGSFATSSIRSQISPF